MLVAEGVGKTFTLHLQGGVRLAVLDGVGMTVRAGECVALMGPSGAGKSTLHAQPAWELPGGSGARSWCGIMGAMVDIAARGPADWCWRCGGRRLGYVSQFLRVVPRVSALKLVAEAAMARGGGDPEAAESRARDLLLRLNIPERLHGLPPATFSGGEQQRVNLARGFVAGQHPVLLLDEPTASLDSENAGVVVVAMINAAKAGVVRRSWGFFMTSRGARCGRGLDIATACFRLQDAA